MAVRKILCILIALTLSLGFIAPGAHAKTVCNSDCCKNNALQVYQQEKRDMQRSCSGTGCSPLDLQTSSVPIMQDCLAFSLRTKTLDSLSISIITTAVLSDNSFKRSAQYFLSVISVRSAPLYLKNLSFIS